MSDDEFKVLGNSMESLSIKYGIFLVVWGAMISWLSGSVSITSWIPAIIGFPIFISGWLTRINPARRKLFMHFGASFGLFALIGGLTFIRDITSELGAFHNAYAGMSKLVLLISGGMFFFTCVQSFKFARKKKN